MPAGSRGRVPSVFVPSSSSHRGYFVQGYMKIDRRARASGTSLRTRQKARRQSTPHAPGCHRPCLASDFPRPTSRQSAGVQLHEKSSVCLTRPSRPARAPIVAEWPSVVRESIGAFLGTILRPSAHRRASQSGRDHGRGNGNWLTLELLRKRLAREALKARSLGLETPEVKR